MELSKKMQLFHKESRNISYNLIEEILMLTYLKVNKMLKNKVVIIPGIKIKIGIFILRFLPRNLVRKIAYKIQKSKEN